MINPGIEYRPIRAEEWLPDRCMAAAEPFDPASRPQASGCPSLDRSYARGSREKLVHLYLDVLDRYGCCGFVAWSDSRVIGFNNFFPTEVARRIRFFGWGSEDGPSETLVHNCISLARDPWWRRRGIGATLIERSVDWAAQNGWRRFEVHRVLPDLKAAFENDQKSCVGFWRKLGFEVVATEKASPETRSVYDVSVRHSMALDLARWKAKTG